MARESLWRCCHARCVQPVLLLRCSAGGRSDVGELVMRGRAAVQSPRSSQLSLCAYARRPERLAHVQAFDIPLCIYRTLYFPHTTRRCLAIKRRDEEELGCWRGDWLTLHGKWWIDGVVAQRLCCHRLTRARAVGGIPTTAAAVGGIACCRWASAAAGIPPTAGIHLQSVTCVLSAGRCLRCSVRVRRSAPWPSCDGREGGSSAVQCRTRRVLAVCGGVSAGAGSAPGLVPTRWPGCAE